MHVIGNDVVRSAHDGELVMTAILLLYERDRAGELSLQRALDTCQRFRRDPDRWRISSRTTRPVHRSDAR